MQNGMYDKVHYHLDNQTYLFALFAESPRGQSFLHVSFILFIVCLVSLAISFAIVWRSKSRPVEISSAPRNHGRYHNGLMVFAILFCAFLFLIRNAIVYEYMDYSYFYEGDFRNFRDFLFNKVYFSNIHRPGYLLVSWGIRELARGAREAYILLNLVALAATVSIGFKILSKNLRPASACAAAAAYLMSPMTVYSAFRISPYTIIAFLFVLLVHSYMEYCETAHRKHAAGMLACVFLLPFFHVLTSVGLAIFFTVAALRASLFLRRGWHASMAAFAVILTALGSGIFNLWHLVFFNGDIQAISVPSTTRLGVYFEFPGGAWEYLLFSLKTIPAIYLSFMGEHPVAAAVACLLFGAGGAWLCSRGKHGLLVVSLGLAAGAVLIATNIANYRQFGGFPMSYRHLHMLGFFFMVPLFAACDRAGHAISHRVPVPASTMCFALTAIYALHFPGLLNVMRGPQMTEAMEYVYANVREYDGVIPGNIYFMNEFHSAFLHDSRNGFTSRPEMLGDTPAEITTGNYLRWSHIVKPGGKTVRNVLLNMSPFSIGSHEELLNNNFVHRVWRFDNETRFLGALPDFSGKYEQDIQNALRSLNLLETNRFLGVTVRLYEVRHEPIFSGPGGRFTISAGVNDYYFVRGALPATGVHASLRAITEDTHILFFVPHGTHDIRVEMTLHEVSPAADLAITDCESGITWRPVNKDRERPLYEIRGRGDLSHFLLSFAKFGKASYSAITIHDTSAGNGTEVQDQIGYTYAD